MTAPMRWRKLGQAFCPHRQAAWMVSHAANPVAEPVAAHRIRVSFSTRDDHNRSSVGWVEIDPSTPGRVLAVSDEPLLSPGRPGGFDDSGASIGCIARAGSQRYLYYTGWNLAVTVPWRNSIGLAVSPTAQAPFTKYSVAPIIDRSEVDPYSVSYPFVLPDGVWRMWYGSNLSWGPRHEDMRHVIKYAESADGVAWQRRGIVALSLHEPGEWGLSKPSVMREQGIYRMWYSRRSGSYRVGYAESPDGIAWVRKDDLVGIDVSSDGWDAEMIEYPFVFDHSGARYMLYNGNGFGKSGFGVAVLEQD